MNREAEKTQASAIPRVNQTEKPRPTYFQWMRLGCALHFGILFVLLPGVIAFAVFQTYMRQLRYEPVQGTVVKSLAEPCEDGMFSPTITFSYTVDRRKYWQGKYRDDFGRMCTKKQKVEALLAQYPPGSTVDAWYDPEAPSLAVIDRSMGMMQYGVLIILGGFSVILALAWWFQRLNRARAVNGGPLI